MDGDNLFLANFPNSLYRAVSCDTPALLIFLGQALDISVRHDDVSTTHYKIKARVRGSTAGSAWDQNVVALDNS